MTQKEIDDAIKKCRWLSDKKRYGVGKGTFKVLDAIKNGIVLPKEHGRIMDVDKIIKKMEEREEQLKDDRSIWETAVVETAVDMFGETIIEADRSEE